MESTPHRWRREPSVVTGALQNGYGASADDEASFNAFGQRAYALKYLAQICVTWLTSGTVLNTVGDVMHSHEQI
ncbi:hypothetical protein HaLaN_04529 [Haematococcus lacustris]|uniref:Uncharacterized protein n=1 Tax=Haematococcus lacustris TaxID=44745 RepID=A0A699Z1Y9_HAELA|nr:hypothetical protein HaLaN_04529 [Haematococcus lacustris]